MPRYFFDTREDDKLARDDVGIDLPDTEAAKHAAARGMADLCSELLPSSQPRKLAIEVSDELRRPVLRLVLMFKIEEGEAWDGSHEPWT
jgi:hypothetical protein